MFFIYMTYTLLALHLQECAVAGIMLGMIPNKMTIVTIFGHNQKNLYFSLKTIKKLSKLTKKALI